MNKTIFIINHSVENCGVYQYGKRLGEIAVKSKNFNILYLEVNDAIDFQNLINLHNPEIIIYNYMPVTLPWVSSDLVQMYRNQNIYQGMIVHYHPESFFDFYLHQDPNYKNNGFHMHLLRPLFLYENKFELPLDEIRIGSFGFGGYQKYTEQICALVNKEFLNENVKLKLHITQAHFTNNAHEQPVIYDLCIKQITRSNIKLEITTEFISNEELLDFLAQNHLNIFFYQNYPQYNGLSSSIDYALSVQRPIALNKSNVHSHLYTTDPSIFVEDLSLKQILSNGIKPLEKFYLQWGHSGFINDLEKSLNHLILSRNINIIK